jgi:hypothetical protein
VTKKQHAPRLSENAKKAPPERASTKKQPLRSSESDEKEAGGTTAASRRAEIKRRKAEAQAAAAAEAAAAQLARVEKLRTELYPGGSVTEALAPVRWYVNGWLAEDFLGAISAPPKAGKSFFALHLAICAARGERFYPGLEDFPRPLRVLYCAFEKPRTVRDRIAAHEQELGEIPRDTFWLYAPRRPLALSNAQQVEDFAQLVKRYAPELIFFDTLSRVEGDFEENSVDGTRGMIEALDKIRDTASLFFVHHKGYDTSKQMRGSTNLLASVDLVITVDGVPATALSVKVTASNAAEIPDPLAYAVKTVLLPPLDGEHDKRAVGLLYATSRPEIAEQLAPRVIALLRSSYPEGASRKQLLTGLNEDLSPGEKQVGEKSLGAALTQLKKAGRLYTSGKGLQTRWHAPYEEPEAERDSF